MITAAQARRRPSDSEILSQVQRIMQSNEFVTSPRLCRLLAWTVEQTLQNGGKNLKQYVIGREVFNRKQDFDPRVDSIVRTEAQRLRRKLRQYYESDGLSDPIHISFLPGSYVAYFEKREDFGGSRAKQSVAVLPFENLTANSHLEFFCRGITESIQEHLASSPDMKVISNSSVSRFDAEADLSKVVSELQVTAVVRGSIRQAIGRIRVQAKALDAASGAYLWAGTFDRDVQDIFAIEDEIASSVASSVLVRILPKCSGDASVPPVEAYELYLKGRHHWNRLSPEGCREAIEWFTRTILLFPDYAQPYAGLADAYIWLIFFSSSAPTDGIAPARQSALRAVQLDPNCADAYIALGTLSSIFEGRWSEGERMFHQGLELRPSYVPGFVQRAFARLQMGELEKAQLDQEAALELDPLSPRCHRVHAFGSYLARDYDAALITLERALQLGEIRNTHYLRGLVLLATGRHEQAIEEFLRSIDGAANALYLGALAAAYANSGRKAEAAAALQTLEDLAKTDFVSPIAFVHAYVGAGDVEKALEWLDQAAAHRCLGLMSLKLNPLLDSLRNEADFHRALERINLSHSRSIARTTAASKSA